MRWPYFAGLDDMVASGIHINSSPSGQLAKRMSLLLCCGEQRAPSVSYLYAYSGCASGWQFPAEMLRNEGTKTG